MKILLNIDLNRWQHVIVYRFTVLHGAFLKILEDIIYRPQGKVLFLHVSVCPQSALWILVHCLSLVTARSVCILLECFLVLLCGQLIPLFRTSGDIDPGLEYQGGFPHLHASSPMDNRFLRFYSRPPLIKQNMVMYLHALQSRIYSVQ